MNKEFLAIGACNGLLTQFNLQDVYSSYPDETSIKEATINNLYFIFEFCTPICFPLSLLTKPIQIKGYGDMPFVPIIELAKICKVSLKLVGEWVIDEHLAQNCARLQDNYFWYNGDSFLYSILTEQKEHKMIVHNQQELFMQLHKWHFAIGLEEGEYIPVTNEFNPYK
jgi:hypothetical protein